MPLPQGPWFPWSREFRWDRFPWQGTTAHEARARQDQRDLTILVEAAATTIGAVARRAGFVFRADASRVSSQDGEREAAMLYEADPDELADRFPAMESERGQSCVDLWIYWSPDAGTLDISGPVPAYELDRPDGDPIRDADALRAALTRHAATLADGLGLERD